MMFPGDEPLPRHGSPVVEARRGYPNADRLTSHDRVDIFDPALKQYERAFRQGDPVLDDMDAQSRWETVRDAAMAHMLRIIESSPWKTNLVLRGSLLLKAWLGNDARPPKDIDWVVIPQSMTTTSEEARDMMDGIIDRVSQNPSADLAMIDAKGAVRDAIWTYERADGMRITFPWKARDLPEGTIQMDFVFGEALWAPSVPTSLSLSGGAPISLLAATPELSLAWKLLWLLTDCYPQGKDLYDATLLAERVVLPPHLIECLAKHEDIADLSGIKSLRVDWDNFAREYPWIQGSESEWFQRFLVALERSQGGALAERL